MFPDIDEVRNVASLCADTGYCCISFSKYFSQSF
jgi:hypothetical protein